MMATATPTKAAAKQEDQWKAEQDADTLMRAEEIKMDKPRHARACEVLRKKMPAMASAMEKSPRKSTYKRPGA